MRRIRFELVTVVLAGSFAGTVGAQSAGGDIFSGFQAKSKDPIQVDARTLETFEENKQRISIFSGNVIVTRGPTVLTATTLKLYSATGGGKAARDPKSGGFSRIEATGPVHVTSGDQAVSGDNAVVDMPAQLLTLTGNVVLVRAEDVATGRRLVVDLRTGKAKFGGDEPIRVVIGSQTASGVDAGAAKSPAAPVR